MSSSAPPIPKALLDYLQQTFPNTLPENPVEHGQLGILIGQQKVVRHLQAQFVIQSRTVLAAT